MSYYGVSTSLYVMKTTTLSELNMSLPGHCGKSYGGFVKMTVDFNIWEKKKKKTLQGEMHHTQTYNLNRAKGKEKMKCAKHQLWPLF